MNEYLNDLRKLKILSNKEKVDYHKKMMNGDKAAKDALIESCLPLVFHLVKKMHSVTHPGFLDLLSDSSLEIATKIEKWNPQRACLNTFVGRIVQNFVVRQRFRYLSSIYVPRIRYLQSYDITDEKLYEMPAHYRLDVLSARAARTSTSYVYQLPKSHTKKFFEFCDEGISAEEFADILSLLNPKEKDILYMHFIEGKKYEECAKKYNTSRQLIEIVARDALIILKHVYNKKYLQNQ